MNNQEIINFINNYLSRIKAKDMLYTLDLWIYETKRNIKIYKKILKHNSKVSINIEKDLLNLQQSELLLDNLLMKKIVVKEK